MHIYNYDRDTGIYVPPADPANPPTADPDPFTAGEYLIPAFATTIEPPEYDPETQVVVFADSAWHVQAIPAPPEPPAPSDSELWAVYQSQARIAIFASDITVLRCVENAVTVPPAWRNYRSALRTILSAASGNPLAPLPTRPAYPAGS